jgi:hypothetical protein
MAKIRIKGREILEDIRSGVDDAGLMQKYGLSAKGILQIMGKLVSSGLLEPGELAQRKSLAKTVFLQTFKCSSCGEIHYSRFDVCPTCDVAMKQLK